MKKSRFSEEQMVKILREASLCAIRNPGTVMLARDLKGLGEP